MKAAFVKNQVLPVIKGIALMEKEYRRELMVELMQSIKSHFPGCQLVDNNSFNELHFWNRETGELHVLTGLGFITSIGVGKYKNVWDTSDWSKMADNEELNGICDAADIDNKVKAYAQSLRQENEVLQKAAVAHEKHAAQVKKMMARVNKKLSRANSDMALGEFIFEGITNNDETAGLWDLYDATKFMFEELVVEYKYHCENAAEYADEM